MQVEAATMQYTESSPVTYLRQKVVLTTDRDKLLLQKYVERGLLRYVGRAEGFDWYTPTVRSTILPPCYYIVEVDVNEDCYGAD